MPADLDRVVSKACLLQAWQWLKSNPEPYYKNQFRDLYSIYSAAEGVYIQSLSTRLRRNQFQTRPTKKILLPKPSGLLRPITLLSLEDQIVYQSFANEIAEKLKRQQRKVAYKTVFGHIYAGKNSVWFYRDWQEGYRKFQKKVRSLVGQGFNYGATFDLTACYDTIDHRVLGFCVNKLGLSEEFTNSLLLYLHQWTGLTPTKGGTRIYHGHGIPQGPMSSGIISETVLQAFEQSRMPKSVAYLRYVDDIRLYSKSEKDLRLALIALDCTSKLVGLFPQSSKIRVRKIGSVQEEVNSLSNPREPSYRNRNPEQDVVHKRITTLSRRFRISDTMRFKFNLSVANPRAIQSRRLIKILYSNPSLYDSILRYFRKYQSIPDEFAFELLEILEKNEPPYFSLQAAILETTLGNVSTHVRGN